MKKTQKARAMEARNEQELKKVVEQGGIAQPVKIREVLSDFFLKRRNIIDPDFMKALLETARREPTMADSYGTYKPGSFTYGAFCVEVGYTEDNLWTLTITPGEKHGTVPENVIGLIRDKYIPDSVWMVKFYPPREERDSSGVVFLMEMPSEEKEAGEEE